MSRLPDRNPGLARSAQSVAADDVGSFPPQADSGSRVTMDSPADPAYAVPKIRSP